MKLIAGLGNPGIRYRNTRHNAGFLVIDRLAKKHRIRVNKRLHSSVLGKSKIAGEQVTLIKPQTFMNNSGIALKQAACSGRVDVKDILVICDDVNLKLGTIRVRPAGGAGGHKGLSSAIKLLGTEDFPRLRIGVGRQENQAEDLADHVLSAFRSTERKRISEIIETAACAVDVWIKDGIDVCMNKFN
ncbi:MAG: aminoacyl-tRNA hydrolase [Candidatus Omnitrophota bacterium]